MIRVEKNMVKVEGTFAELLMELSVCAASIKKIVENETGDDPGTFILETVAFALCSKEEQETVLREKEKELMEEVER